LGDDRNNTDHECHAGETEGRVSNPHKESIQQNGSRIILALLTTDILGLVAIFKADSCLGYCTTWAVIAAKSLGAYMMRVRGFDFTSIKRKAVSAVVM
jgi:hypothetical protein